VAALCLLVLESAGCHTPPAAAEPPLVGAAAERAAEGELLAKARAFRAAILERHLTPEGLLLYVVDLRRIRSQLATGGYEALADTPTYTGLLAATSCTRADVESGSLRAEALDDAARALSGLELLMKVTGVPGLLARGVQRGPPPPPREAEHRWFRGAPGFEGFAWRGDASMDQYANGLLPAVAACRHHFPERVRALVTDLAGMLLETRMQLVDPDGRRTTYGDLSAGSGWGFNAIARLTGYAAFALAAELDADPRWAAQRDRLRDDERVVAGSTLTNLKILGITNYSNDLMAWNLYRVLVPLAQRTGDPALADLLRGVRRTWRRVAPDRNAYFTIAWCRLVPGECTGELIEDALRTLVRFPLEKRRLAPAPELAALPRALLPGRKWHPRARDVVPVELRPPDSMEWKASPYRVRAPTAPETEYTGLDYLTAYWLYRELLASS
jgi:hypothetical protein